MTTTDQKIEVTEAEITAAGNDYHQAVEMKRHKLRAAAEIAAREAKPPAESPDGWMLEPTSAMVLAAIANRGIVATPATLEHFRDQLRKELRDDYIHLKAASPSAADEIRDAQKAANDAQQRAESVFADRIGTLDALRGLIVTYIQIQIRIERLQRLALNDDAARLLAEQTVKSYFAAIESPCTLNQSTFSACLEDLALRKAVTPHIPDMLSPLESQAANLRKEIQDSALAEGVHLDVLLRSISTELRTTPGNFTAGASSDHMRDLWKNDQTPQN